MDEKACSMDGDPIRPQVAFSIFKTPQAFYFIPSSSPRPLFNAIPLFIDPRVTRSTSMCQDPWMGIIHESRATAIYREVGGAFATPCMSPLRPHPGGSLHAWPVSRVNHSKPYMIFFYYHSSIHIQMLRVHTLPPSVSMFTSFSVILPTRVLLIQPMYVQSWTAHFAPDVCSFNPLRSKYVISLRDFVPLPSNCIVCSVITRPFVSLVCVRSYQSTRRFRYYGSRRLLWGADGRMKDKGRFRHRQVRNWWLGVAELNQAAVSRVWHKVNNCLCSWKAQQA